MNFLNPTPEKSPLYHTRRFKVEMGRLVDDLRSDLGQVTDPRLQALLETAAEVIGGLAKAFGDFEARNEAAWRH